MKSPLWQGYALALFFVSLFAACKKEPAAENTLVVMRANLAGVSWEARPVAQVLNGILELTGVADDGSVIALSTNAFAESEFPVGPHTTNWIKALTVGTHAALYNNLMNGSSGSIRITAIDESARTVSGTFQATLTNPLTGAILQIDHGIFENVPYPEPVARSAADMFSAKLDNAPWQAPIVVGQAFDGQLRLIASNATGYTSVLLQMNTHITPGTYAFGNRYAGFSAQYRPDTNTLLQATGGELVVEYHDKVKRAVGGTFSFTATQISNPGQQAQFTQGRFWLNY